MRNRRKIGSRSGLSFFDDLAKDVEVYKEMMTQNRARIASEVIEDEFLTIMDMFYEDYTPCYYQRTGGIRNNSCARYYKKVGKSYRGGIALSSHDMSQEDYRADADYIFDISIIRGWHGSESVFVSKPTPFESIKIFRDSLVKEMQRGGDSYNIIGKAVALTNSAYRMFVRGGKR